MSHQIKDTTLPNVKLITPDIFEDHRGCYTNLWNTTLNLLPEGTSWQEDDLSCSRQGVIRGFHGDTKTWKLVTCLHGRIFTVVVNRETRKWESFGLDSIDRHLLLVPPNHGLAHQVLTTFALFWYKQSELYSGAENQFTIHPFDPKLNVDWPMWLPGTFILSERDNNAEFLV